MPSIISNPTFESEVELLQPGNQPVQKINFTFVHKTRKEIEKINDELEKNNDEDINKTIEIFMKVVKDWDYDEEFNKENIAILDQNNPIALREIYTTYLNEVMGYRRKN